MTGCSTAAGQPLTAARQSSRLAPSSWLRLAEDQIQRWQALAQAQRARLAPGPDSTLTPTERRIADLVAAGQTNPEITATLYISVKTVEANLTRIYRKLGYRGRVELARGHRS
jgi:DNA-binding CsgD family transcriptional regulator